MKVGPKVKKVKLSDMKPGTFFDCYGSVMIRTDYTPEPGTIGCVEMETGKMIVYMGWVEFPSL